MDKQANTCAFLQRERNYLWACFLFGEFFQQTGEGLLYWCSSSLRSPELREWDEVPLEVQPPVEAPPHHRGRAVGQGVGADDVDHRAHHRPPVLLDGGQQGLQPQHVHLAVAVQEHQDFSCGGKPQRPWGQCHSRFKNGHQLQGQHLCRGESSRHPSSPSYQISPRSQSAGKSCFKGAATAEEHTQTINQVLKKVTDNSYSPQLKKKKKKIVSRKQSSSLTARYGAVQQEWSAVCIFITITVMDIFVNLLRNMSLLQQTKARERSSLSLVTHKRDPLPIISTTGLSGVRGMQPAHHVAAQLPAPMDPPLESHVTSSPSISHLSFLIPSVSWATGYTFLLGNKIKTVKIFSCISNSAW